MTNHRLLVYHFTRLSPVAQLTVITDMGYPLRADETRGEMWLRVFAQVAEQGRFMEMYDRIESMLKSGVRNPFHANQENSIESAAL